MARSEAFPLVPVLVASIHDVSPLTWRRVDAMLGDLGRIGVRRTSLLVVPDHHRRGRMTDDAAFCEWLRERVREGHEAVVHGYNHLREPASGEGLWKRWVTRSYTAGEGEFFDLGEREAGERIGRALEEFRRAELDPRGFIAPAWLLGAEAERAVRRAGFEYTTRIGTISDYRAGVTHRSQSLVYSVRAGWRRAVSLAWNGALLRVLLPRTGLLRVGLHPPDWDFPAIRVHAEKCILRGLAGREAMPYDDWLDRQRAVMTP
jgi:predicted deacetylase